MAGQALAKALDLRGHISDIVARYPGAELINKDPPIIHCPAPAGAVKRPRHFLF
jgi:hypothetical protein